jgi:hypothetical protein
LILLHFVNLAVSLVLDAVSDKRIRGQSDQWNDQGSGNGSSLDWIVLEPSAGSCQQAWSGCS